MNPQEDSHGEGSGMDLKHRKGLGQILAQEGLAILQQSIVSWTQKYVE